MADRTAAFFDDLSVRGHLPELRKVRGTVRCDVTGDEDTQHWRIEIDHGDVNVSHRSGEADCVLRAEHDLFDGLTSGRLNAMAEMLRGGLVVRGDLELLVLFQRLLPAPPSSGAPDPIPAR